MNTRDLVLFSTTTLVLAACGGEASEPKGSDGPTEIVTQNNGVTPIEVTPEERRRVDPRVACGGSFCGDERFLAAIPTRNTVAIRYGQAGGAPGALADISPAFLAVDEHVAEINGAVDDIFGAIETIAATEPVHAEEDLHVWRAVLDGVDVELQVSTDDGSSYEFALGAGEQGFEFDTASLGVTGTVLLDARGEKESFEFVIAYDELGAFAEDDYVGEFLIRALPTEYGLWKVHYDLAEADAYGETFETTTYWVLGEFEGAMEYAFADIDFEGAAEGEVFVRWDESGGRYDAFVLGEDDEIGLYDLVVTDCWDGFGSQVFEAELVVGELDAYASVDGFEDDCAWELVDAHPDAEAELLALFTEYSWEEYAAEYDDFDSWEDPASNNGVEPTNNGVEPTNNGAGDACLDEAQIIYDTLVDCGYETFESDLPAERCFDPVAVSDCLDALDASFDPCETIVDPVCE